MFLLIQTKFQHTIPSKELRVILESLNEGKVNVPVLPDLVSGKVQEDFKEALLETGVLHALTQTGGRRGNFVMKIAGSVSLHHAAANVAIGS